MPKGVNINSMASEIMKAMSEYKDAISLDVKECCRNVARRTAKDIKTSSPRRSGNYAKGWKTTVKKESSMSISLVVHDEEYQLCHLLEYGHAKRGGGRVEALPHIKKAEQEATEMLLKEIEKAL